MAMKACINNEVSILCLFLLSVITVITLSNVNNEQLRSVCGKYGFKLLWNTHSLNLPFKEEEKSWFRIKLTIIQFIIVKKVI